MGMKQILVMMAAVVLVVGCGEAKQEAIDWDDNETRDKIIAEALEFGPHNMPDKELFWKDSILVPHFGGRRKLIVKSTKRLFTGWMKDMYDNGQIKSLEQCKDGLQDGLRIEWYSNGKKMYERNYKNRKLVTALSWRPNGEKCPDTSVVNGNGVVWEFRGGGLNTEGFGGFKSTYKDGVVLEGIQSSGAEWYENGQKAYEVTRKRVKGGKLWTVVAWKPNGKKCPQTNVVDGNGVWARYNEDGMEKSRDTYKDGKRNGLSIRWDENGQKQEETSWKDGKQNGLSIRWYWNGQKRSERNWKDDKLDGVAVFYHEDGTERSRYTYKDSKIVRD